MVHVVCTIHVVSVRLPHPNYPCIARTGPVRWPQRWRCFSARWRAPQRTPATALPMAAAAAAAACPAACTAPRWPSTGADCWRRAGSTRPRRRCTRRCGCGRACACVWQAAACVCGCAPKWLGGVGGVSGLGGRAGSAGAGCVRAQRAPRPDTYRTVAQSLAVLIPGLGAGAST